MDFAPTCLHFRLQKYFSMQSPAIKDDIIVSVKLLPAKNCYIDQFPSNISNK